jgi:PAS domain S-box-containing protein
MKDQKKTKVQLIRELAEMSRLASELETSEKTCRQIEEAALKKAAADISDLYHNAPCGYHSIDRNGLFLRMNKTELNWLGYSEEEIVGKKRIHEVLTPESAKVFRKRFSSFIKQGWISDLDFDMIRKDGTILTVLLSATAIYDDRGRYLMSRSTLFDNTERKLAEKKLLESQERMELALKGGALGSWDVDLKTGHTTVNERWAEILGYAYGEIKDPREVWLDTIHPEDIDRVLKLGRDFRKGRIRKYEVEYRGITRQGKVVWLVSKAVNVGRGPNGVALRMVGTFQDITERKLSEEKMVALNRELDDANKQLQLAYAWMRDSRDQLRDHMFKEGIGFLVDREGRIEGMAERVLEATGMQRQKIIGTPMVDLFSEGCRASFKTELGRAWKGISHPIKVEMRTAGAEVATFQTNITRYTMRSKRLLLIILH